MSENNTLDHTFLLVHLYSSEWKNLNQQPLSM